MQARPVRCPSNEGHLNIRKGDLLAMQYDGVLICMKSVSRNWRLGVIILTFILSVVALYSFFLNSVDVFCWQFFVMILTNA